MDSRYKNACIIKDGKAKKRKEYCSPKIEMETIFELGALGCEKASSSVCDGGGPISS